MLFRKKDKDEANFGFKIDVADMGNGYVEVIFYTDSKGDSMLVEEHRLMSSFFQNVDYINLTSIYESSTNYQPNPIFDPETFKTCSIKVFRLSTQKTKKNVDALHKMLLEFQCRFIKPSDNAEFRKEFVSAINDVNLVLQDMKNILKFPGKPNNDGGFVVW